MENLHFNFGNLTPRFIFGGLVILSALIIKSIVKKVIKGRTQERREVMMTQIKLWTTCPKSAVEKLLQLRDHIGIETIIGLISLVGEVQKIELDSESNIVNTNVHGVTNVVESTTDTNSKFGGGTDGKEI